MIEEALTRIEQTPKSDMIQMYKNDFKVYGDIGVPFLLAFIVAFVGLNILKKYESFVSEFFGFSLAIFSLGLMIILSVLVLNSIYTLMLIALLYFFSPPAWVILSSVGLYLISAVLLFIFWARILYKDLIK